MHLVQRLFNAQIPLHHYVVLPALRANDLLSIWHYYLSSQNPDMSGSHKRRVTTQVTSRGGSVTSPKVW